MKYFFLKFGIVSVVFYLILFCFEKSLDYYLSKENICKSNTWNKLYNGKLSADIIVVGNSRAEVHYDTRIILDETGLETFNLGLSGTHYNLFSIRWNSFINYNKPPKVIIVDLDASSLSFQNEIYEKYQYLPYFNKKEYIEVAQKLDKDFYYEMFFPLYKYRGYEMSVINQIKSLYSDLNCPKNYNGYIEHDIAWIKRDYLKLLEEIKKQSKVGCFNPKVYAEGLKVIQRIIDYGKNNNIKVIFVTSPIYFEAHKINHYNNSELKKIIQKVALDNHIEYYDFSNDDDLCNNKNYFYNSSHLNKKGAIVFSKKIGNVVKNSW